MTPSDQAPKLWVYLDERNAYPFNGGCQYYFRVRHRDTRASSNSAASLDEAKEIVRQRMLAQKEHCLKLAAGWERQLAELDAMTADPGPVGLELVAGYAELVEALRAYKERPTPGSTKDAYFPSPKVGRTQLVLGYMSKPELLVFSLPEYDTVTHTFDALAVATLRRAVTEVFGTERIDDWNGEGLYSYSIRLSASAMAPAAAEETSGA